MTDWQRLIEAAMSQSFYDLGLPILHDMTEVDFNTDTGSMLATGRTPVKPVQESVSRIVAMVTPSALGFGMIGIVARLRTREYHRTLTFKTMPEAAAAIDRPQLAAGIPAAIASEMRTSLANAKDLSEIAIVPEPG